jgi:hypothetical protein
VSSSEWFRLLRYFGDYVIVRYNEQGRKLVFPVAVVAHSPVIGGHSADSQAWAATKSLLLPLQAEPTPFGDDELSF